MMLSHLKRMRDMREADANLMERKLISELYTSGEMRLSGLLCPCEICLVIIIIIVAS